MILCADSLHDDGTSVWAWDDDAEGHHTLHHTLSILLCPYLGISLYIFCYMNI